MHKQHTQPILLIINLSSIEHLRGSYKPLWVVAPVVMLPQHFHLSSKSVFPWKQQPLRIAWRNIFPLKVKIENILELSDYYECEKCKNRTKATKQTSITKTPNFLVIVIKKFTSSGRKIEERINYNLKMDLRKHCKGHYG